MAEVRRSGPWARAFSWKRVAVVRDTLSHGNPTPRPASGSGRTGTDTEHEHPEVGSRKSRFRVKDRFRLIDDGRDSQSILRKFGPSVRSSRYWGFPCASGDCVSLRPDSSRIPWYSRSPNHRGWRRPDTRGHEGSVLVGRTALRSPCHALS